MPVFTKGSFGGDIDEADRQCAWELYTELVSRVAVVGKVDDSKRDVFVGELMIESLDSLYAFVKEARGTMRKYPVGQLTAGKSQQSHLGFFIAGMLETVLRPFLEKWQAAYRHWWGYQSRLELQPFERQAEFPRLAEFQADWAAMRQFCREAADKLVANFRLPRISTLMPPEMKRQWRQETEQVVNDH